MTFPPGQPPGYQPYPPPAYPYGQYGQTPAPYPPKPSTNGFAIASLILGILGGVPLSVIFGIIALNQIKRSRQGGRGMAIAGLVLSGLWTLLIIAIVVLAIVFDDGSVPGHRHQDRRLHRGITRGRGRRGQAAEGVVRQATRG